MRPIAGAFILAIVILSFACKKELKGDEPDLHGTWVKGSNLGDTVWFMKKNDQHIIRYAISFNPAMPMYQDQEYKYKDGKLSIKSFSPSSNEFFPKNSFAWVQPGTEFSIVNSELYPFLSSIITFKFRKV